MDPLIPRRPQDPDRGVADGRDEPAADPTAGPGDRWLDGATPSDPAYPVHDSGEGGTNLLGEPPVVDDGSVGADPTLVDD